MINKFLHPNGGSETYIFRLGSHLQEQGHDVQYFGMEHEGRCVGNAVNAYTRDMDLHSCSGLSKLTYAFKTIYSIEARKKIRKVLDDFGPDVCHLNNFNYQLTPSIIVEIVKWRKQTKKKCKIIFTAHDYQLICPNHMMNNPGTHANCEKCLGGHYFNCMKHKCIHRSRAKSMIGTVEAYFWHWMGIYRSIDTVICCSAFMKSKMDTDPTFQDKTVVLHNFCEKTDHVQVDKKEYVLYFGRFSWEKGIRTLIDACMQLPDISFVVAGAGTYERELSALPNVTNVGFKHSDGLDQIIREARFSICPSECYENCPFSIMESQVRGTPVLGAAIGGIPELILDGINGRLFESGNAKDLKRVIQEMYMDEDKLQVYTKNCVDLQRDTVEGYCERLIKIYGT